MLTKTNSNTPTTNNRPAGFTDLEVIHDEIARSRHTLTIVEGPKDQRALECLGFTRVTHLKGPLYSVVEHIDDEEVILLTDLDEHGRQLYTRLYTDLTRRGVRVNNRLRLLLFQTPVRHIEGLASYLRRRGDETARSMGPSE